ncbi:type I restriction endonuclease subunit R [Marivita sp. GX14005]|uniref:type I restriction endonuclease subunit R n=1 Tax=Marivita sp. GX14005 TaxID=2942276 RepID=UPI0020194ED6|nr:type I restriction endonuclease subunit R [Marivita sp. GX14005]MCL3883567.1 type I restriction endonuclease subunit R [Marivita sp. GX14005]
MAYASEADLELWTLGELTALGFTHLPGAATDPDAIPSLRQSYRDTLLLPRLTDAIRRLNPHLPDSAVQTAVNALRDTIFAGDLISENRRIHEALVGGVKVTWVENGEERSDLARLIDWDNAQNDWLAVSQFEVAGKSLRRPDIVLFLNGLPVVVIELKGTESGTLKGAFNQIDTYKAQIPDLFRTNAFSVISEGVTARYGSLSADFDRFMRWRTVDGETVIEDTSALALQVLTRGLLDPANLLQMIRWFTVFEDEGRGPIKKIAGYHQFHAVRKGVAAVFAARGRDGRGGVMWHTQGSGKSLLMAFLGGRLMRDPGLQNPTLVIITDRNDLDNQLFATFSRCAALFGEKPEQAEGIEDLKRLLDRKVGGVIFATIQKFRPGKGEDDFGLLTDRDNVIVFADEAHRSQYGFEAKIDAETGETRYGFAHHLRVALPNAVHIGFTGTPVSLVGADTQGVFGDYIDIYDVTRAVEDGATVPIYYEGRVARITTDQEIMDQIDAEFDGIVDEAEDSGSEMDDRSVAALKSRWSRVEALVGADNRLNTVVADILNHFDARLEAMDGGKAMIVCMSRRICTEVYARIVAARPDWHAQDDTEGAVKVIMTGSAQDPAAFQPHIRSKSRQEALRNRYRDPADPLKLVIVRDMWLTGFDAPCMHTLYVDKPMKGHGLMQAIARVNRVFRDKPSGLVVDYIGLAADLKKALAHYSASDQQRTGVDQREAIDALMTALGVMRDMFHGVDYMSALDGTPQDRIHILPVAIEHALTLPVFDKDGKPVEGGDRTLSKKRFMKAATRLITAFRIASGSAEAENTKDEVSFFAAVQAAIRKLDAASASGRSAENTEFAISQLINQAVGSTEVIDILKECGVDRPDIGVLDEAFLLGIQSMEQKNLAVEALRRLLNGEISSRTRTNLAKKDAFSKRLTEAIARYHNRSIDALQVIQELLKLAHELREEPEDGLSQEEAAFYDALARSESAMELMGNEELRVIAAELVNTVRASASVDWWRKDNVRTKIRVAVKRILKKHGFPPDLQAEAIKHVVQQAEAMAREVS